jgi:hypothetical protein
VVCAAVFISGLETDVVVANAGYIPPFDVRKQLGKPVVATTAKTSRWRLPRVLYVAPSSSIGSRDA